MVSSTIRGPSKPACSWGAEQTLVTHHGLQRQDISNVEQAGLASKPSRQKKRTQACDVACDARCGTTRLVRGCAVRLLSTGDERQGAAASRQGCAHLVCGRAGCELAD